MHEVKLSTFIFTLIFSIAYYFYLWRKTVKEEFDIYDVLMLSMLGTVPGVFVYFPKYSYLIAETIGVEYPFVVMFGILFMVLFIMLIRVISIIHKISNDNIMLIQKIALIDFDLKNCKKNY